MALKVLMLKKELDTKRKALAELETRDDEFTSREAELETAIEEAATEEERNLVTEEIEKFEREKEEHDKAKTDLDEEIRGLETELDELEEKQAPAEPEADEEDDTPEETRKVETKMETRKFFNMNTRERAAFFADEAVQSFLTETRSAIKEKRAITNVGLTVPEVMLGLIRENIENYSKLYKHVNVKIVNGEARAVIMSEILEAVWTDCCANLNELTLGFNSVELDCWKVGGFYSICNANIEDSDIDLASEILTAIGQAIGLALDKAILYGLGTRMPLGVVARLAQTTKPSDYPDTAREWVDLHTSNIISIDSASMTAVEAFAAIVEGFGAAKGKYSRGEKVFAMNEKTYTSLAAKAVSVDADGNIVTGVFGRMPIIGGIIEVLNFIPDDVIIGGYFDCYLLAERAGQKFATSEHVRFLQDQTVMKGTARYDGQPAIAEAFVAIGLNGTTPDAEMTFAPDDANSEDSE